MKNAIVAGPHGKKTKIKVGGGREIKKGEYSLFSGYKISNILLNSLRVCSLRKKLSQRYGVGVQNVHNIYPCIKICAFKIRIL